MIARSRLQLNDSVSERNLFRALLAYAEGSPVVVFDDKGYLLHGEETLKGAVAAEATLQSLIVTCIPKKEFEASDWPELLEAARQNFMHGEKLQPSYLQWVKQNTEEEKS
jgi:hypothetical protein